MGASEACSVCAIAEYDMRCHWHVLSLFCLRRCRVWHEVALARLKLVLSVPLQSMTGGGTGMSYFYSVRVIAELHMRWHWLVLSLFCLRHCGVWHEVVLARLKLVLSAPLQSMTGGGTGTSYFYSVVVIAELHMRWYWHVLSLFWLSAPLLSFTRGGIGVY